jgi:hypothetical protein
MRKRLIIFLVCTLFSGIPILISFDIFPSSIARLLSKYGASCFDNAWCAKKLTSTVLLGILVWVAWGFYFIINYRWIRFGYVEKNIRLVGALVGTCALLFSHPYGVLFVLPAVCLMLYIHFKVPYANKA